MSFNVDNFLQQNPWRLDKTKLVTFWFRRDILPQFLKALDDEKPVLLSGPIGAGKTHLLQFVVTHLITERKIQPQAIFYFNMEDRLTLDGFTNTDEVVKFINGFKPDDKGRLWIFIDEIQYLPDGMLQELQQAMSKAKWVMTSSVRGNTPLPLSRGDCSSKVPSNKRGIEGVCKDITHLELELFSYKEYLQRMLEPKNMFLPEGASPIPWRVKLPKDINLLTSTGLFDYIQPLLDEYLLYGGYPMPLVAYSAAERPSRLRKVYQKYFTGETQTGSERLRPNQRAGLLRALAPLHGSVINISKLSHQTKLNRKTISAGLDSLSETYVINRVYPVRSPLPGATASRLGGTTSNGVNPYQEGETAGMPLVYFADNGLRNMLVDMFMPLATRPDRDILLDNLLYNELRFIPWVKGINFWQSQTSKATGFCFKHGVVMKLVGVLYDFPQEKTGRWSLVNFGKRIKAKKIVVLTRDYAQIETIGPTTIIYLPAAWAWILHQALGD